MLMLMCQFNTSSKTGPATGPGNYLHLRMFMTHLLLKCVEWDIFQIRNLIANNRFLGTNYLVYLLRGLDIRNKLQAVH